MEYGSIYGGSVLGGKFAEGVVGGGMLMLQQVGGGGIQSNGPKPARNFKTPTNQAQLPPANIPEGYTLRVMKPTQHYPNGYWRLSNEYNQPVDISTMKPGREWETHIPLPPKNI